MWDVNYLMCLIIIRTMQRKCIHCVTIFDDERQRRMWHRNLNKQPPFYYCRVSGVHIESAFTLEKTMRRKEMGALSRSRYHNMMYVWFVGPSYTPIALLQNLIF